MSSYITDTITILLKITELGTKITRTVFCLITLSTKLLIFSLWMIFRIKLSKCFIWWWKQPFRQIMIKFLHPRAKLLNHFWRLNLFLKSSYLHPLIRGRFPTKGSGYVNLWRLSVCVITKQTWSIYSCNVFLLMKFGR